MGACFIFYLTYVMLTNLSVTEYLNSSLSSFGGYKP